MRASSLLTVFLLTVSLLVACGDDDSTGGDAGPGVVDAGGGDTDAGPGGDVDAGPGGDVDAGPPSGDTWSTTIMPLFTRYCVDHHMGPPSGRDYRTIDDVRRDADTIRCGVTPAAEPIAGCTPPPSAGMFPVGSGPFPTDEERRQIVAWIEAGLPE